MSLDRDRPFCSLDFGLRGGVLDFLFDGLSLEEESDLRLFRLSEDLERDLEERLLPLAIVTL